MAQAQINHEQGVLRYSIVTSGKRLSDAEVDEMCEAVRKIRGKVGISVCVSFGLLDEQQFRRLKEAGVTRVHNNLETSRRNFPNICTTHTFDNKIQAIRAARAAGLSVCSGGIMGLGETVEDRIDMALTLRELGILSVPVNMLNAYHGGTFKTMEVGDDEDYHFVLKAYGKSEHIVHIPTEISALEQAFAQYHNRLNCFIVEPLLQGAGGMRMYDVSFPERARELCVQYGVLLVFDEVAKGFGRTGNRFAADLVLPDILVLGKALTGGYIGHAVTVAKRKVYEGFYVDDPSHALMHGPTFMGNALACSVALKSIELFEKQDYMSKIRRIEEITRREMEGFSDPRIKEIRIMGACVCIEVYDPDTIRGYQQFAYEHGVFSRPFLNYMYAMVPYVIREKELVKVLQTMKEWFS